MAALRDTGPADRRGPERHGHRPRRPGGASCCRTGRRWRRPSSPSPAGATTAPLNPAYKAEEFEFYLSDLNAKALVILAGMESPARAVAADPEHSRRRAGSGRRTARRGPSRSRRSARCPARRAQAGPADAEDVALVLHTSGTTSRPKIVPLRHVNITASACHIGETLALTPDDVLPQHHAAVPHPRPDRRDAVAASAAGAAVCCTPGFNAFRFFAWFDEAQPTWYTAVPTMHQAILRPAPTQRGDHRAGAAALHPLLLVLAAAAGDGGARGDVRRAGDRGLRHDRGVAPDGVQPAAAAAAQARLRSASPPGRRSPSWTRRASCCRPASSARS